jgi:hypothetical protein
VAGRPDLTVTGFDPVAPFEFRWTEDGFTSSAGVESERTVTQERRRRTGTAKPRRRATPRRTK